MNQEEEAISRLPCYVSRHADLSHPPDVAAAQAAWGAACGPASLAAVLKRPVMALRPSLGAVAQCGAAHPSHLLEALSALGLGRRRRTLNAAELHSAFQTAAVPAAFPPIYGLAWVQWTGPWLKPGVSVAAQYRYTHWVGTAVTQEHGLMVYDINATTPTGLPGAWVPCAGWEAEIRPAILRTIPRAEGGYYVRTALAVRW